MRFAVLAVAEDGSRGVWPTCSIEGVEWGAGAPERIVSDAGLPAARRAARALYGALSTATGRQPWIGVGGSIDESSRSEASEAIRFGRELYPTPRVVFFEDLLPAALGEHAVGLTSRIAALLDPLLREDPGGKLFDTLRAFYEADLSSAGAAARLGVHRHTLEYRLRGIEEALGRPVRTFPDRRLVELAVTLVTDSRTRAARGRQT